MHILGVIPARYASTRFPGKPLALIAGLPMIQRVWQQARQAQDLSALVVATDDARIADCVRDFGGQVVMTRADHPTGTDRLMEVMGLHPEADAFINIQGDEPFIAPQQIDQLANALRTQPLADITTLVQPAQAAEDLHNPNKVKVARAADGRALYFSRACIPYPRHERPLAEYFLHVGLYGYRRAALQQIAQLPPGSLELTESLEQLRWLEHGLSIWTDITHHHSYGIDTPDDIPRVLARLGL